MSRFLKVIVAAWFALTGAAAFAEDIDLFASGLANGAAASSLPNVIFVLDNTSNWSRQSQQWPGDLDQGQSEVLAIKNTLTTVLNQNKDLNVALIEFTTDGNANQDGGYVRFDLQPLAGNETQLFAILDKIYKDINDPQEKRNSNSSYGNLASDVYAYLAGEQQSFLGEGTPVTLADKTGYETPYVLFDSPMTESDICSETYVILVSNTDSNGPEGDSVANSDRLASLYEGLGESPSAALAGQSGDGIPMQRYETEKADKNLKPPYAEENFIGSTLVDYQNAKQCNKNIHSNADESKLISESCIAEGDCLCDERAGSGEYTFDVYEAVSVKQHAPVTNEFIDGADFNLDDWTKFLHEFGVPVVIDNEGEVPDSIYRVPVTTYTIDVFNRRPNEEHSALMHSAAEQGGGYRQSATSQAELERALTRIFGDIIDINTAFAAVTLPLSATNRAQAENKVFVGMFRPASQRKPRWLGNLKQYQLAKFDGQIELADVNYDRAINPQTGFAQSCATSFWTEDTSEVVKGTDSEGGLIEGPYFDGLGMEPSPVSECLKEFRELASGDVRSVLSDSPDGPFVEKGGAAQQIRNQISRTIFTEQDKSLIPVSTTSSNIETEVYDYLIGKNPGLKGGDLLVKADDGYIDNPDLDQAEVMPYEGLRPTIHGDIVHSRPLTITYGPIDPDNLDKGSKFQIFYGANDGLFRAVDPATGQEKWALIAPEHLEGLQRLYANTPTVDYFGLDKTLSVNIKAEPKRYFFDGSTGAYTEYDADDNLVTAWIYPTMRRGGREIYALDVSPLSGNAGEPPSKPTLMWKTGPDADTDLEGMGQSWSTPVTGRLRKINADGEAVALADPVLIFGGGWDVCLDEDEATLSAASCTTGNQIFVLNAKTGDVVGKFDTEAPVVGEVSPLDIDNDGFIDFVYAADATGGLYRVNFAKLDALGDPYAEPLDEGDWSITQIAKSSMPSVRFLNKPTIGAIQNRVFVTIGAGDRERPLKLNYPYRQNVSNRFYAFIDEPYVEPTGVVDLDKTTSDSGRAMLDAASGIPDGEFLVPKYRGWFLDLPDQGEQIVNPSAIGGGYVFFNSFQPEGGTKGFCSDLGKSKAYRVPLFRPVKDTGKEYGEGVPIPPIIVTVKLNSGEPSCDGDDCGPGEIPNEVVTVCIGCEGFDPIEIVPASNNTVREAYRAENIDRL